MWERSQSDYLTKLLFLSIVLYSLGLFLTSCDRAWSACVRHSFVSDMWKTTPYVSFDGMFFIKWFDVCGSISVINHRNLKKTKVKKKGLMVFGSILLYSYFRCLPFNKMTNWWPLNSDIIHYDYRHLSCRHHVMVMFSVSNNSNYGLVFMRKVTRLFSPSNLGLIALIWMGKN